MQSKAKTLWPLKSLVGNPHRLDVYREVLPEDEPLQMLRELRRYSQEDLGSILGMARDVVSKLESNPNPRIGSLQKYIAALDGRLILIAEFKRWGYVDIPLPVPENARRAP